MIPAESGLACQGLAASGSMPESSHPDQPRALTRDDVLKVARLARLSLTDDEIESFASQLGQILEYVDILQELNTETVEPMAHAVALGNVLRTDDSAPSLDRPDALANAPLSDGTFFLVPQIISQDSPGS